MNKFLLLGLLVSATVWASEPAKTEAPHIFVMAYNLENFFDTEDDPLVADETFLPKILKRGAVFQKCMVIATPGRRAECLETDWTEAAVELKIRRLTDVIMRANGGKGPDILITEEVENQKILDRLRKEGLKSDYKEAVLLEGWDQRGIDVGLITRYEVVDKKLHKIEFKEKGQTPTESRGILQVDLKTPYGDIITVMGVHLPSQAWKSTFRIQAAQLINRIKDSLPEDRTVIVGGDFNIAPEEEGKEKIYSEILTSRFDVSHLVDCFGCLGTYNYKKRWNFLDAILVSKPASEAAPQGWKFKKGGVQVFNVSKYQISAFGTPARFNEGMGAVGVSDHLPLVAELVRAKPIESPVTVVKKEATTTKSEN